MGAGQGAVLPSVAAWSGWLRSWRVRSHPRQEWAGHVTTEFRTRESLRDAGRDATWQASLEYGSITGDGIVLSGWSDRVRGLGRGRGICGQGLGLGDRERAWVSARGSGRRVCGALSAGARARGGCGRGSCAWLWSAWSVFSEGLRARRPRNVPTNRGELNRVRCSYPTVVLLSWSPRPKATRTFG